MIEALFGINIARYRFTQLDTLTSLADPDQLRAISTDKTKSYFLGDVHSEIFCWDHNIQMPHHRSEFKSLCDFVEDCAKDYWDRSGFYPDLWPRIQQSFLTHYHSGSQVISHNHGNAGDLVAAVYLSVPSDDSNLVFEHPLELLLSTQPYRFEGRHAMNKFDHEIKVTTGDVVIWPSWLRHHSQPNTSTSQRVVLTCDLRAYPKDQTWIKQ